MERQRLLELLSKRRESKERADSEKFIKFVILL